MKKIILICVLFSSYKSFAKKETFQDFSSLRVETNYSKVEINAQDENQQKLRLLSNNNLGMGISLVEHWDEKQTSNIKIQYNKMSFNPLSITPIDNLNQSITLLSVGHTYSFSEFFRLNGSLIFGEELYVRSKDIGFLTIDKFSNLILKFEMDYDIVNKEKFTIGINGGVDLSAPFEAQSYDNTEGTANYKVDAALGYSGSLYGRKYLNGYSLEGSLFMKIKDSKTSVTDQNIITQGINLRLAIPFGY